jgi:hypothetical protein
MAETASDFLIKRIIKWGIRRIYGIACRERVLLPAVRKAAADTLIVADGFSCRDQIRQMTDRSALHLAQVLQMAMKENTRSSAKNFPEMTRVSRKAIATR